MNYLLIFVLFIARLSFGQDTITFPNQAIWEISSSNLAEHGTPFLITLKDTVEHYAGKHIEIIVLEEVKPFHSAHYAVPRAKSILAWLKENSNADPYLLKATGITNIVEKYSGGKGVSPYTLLLVIL